MAKISHECLCTSVIIWPNIFTLVYYPVGTYLLKVKNRNTRTRNEISSKLAIKTPERCQLQTYFTPRSCVLKFEHAIAGWVGISKYLWMHCRCSISRN